MVQWIRIHLPIFLVQEEPTCHRATRPVHPVLCNEKPLQGEAQAPQLEQARSQQVGSPYAATEPITVKTKKIKRLGMCTFHLTNNSQFEDN